MPPWARPADDSATVLVAVMNNAADLEHARRDGWYRIPLARAPVPLNSDYLALYLTAGFADDRWSVRYLAEVWSYEVRRRRELLAQPEHPRADDLYYCLRLGPVQELERPVPARRLRRVTFIRTSLERLLRAEDVRDLWREPAGAVEA